MLSLLVKSCDSSLGFLMGVYFLELTRLPVLANIVDLGITTIHSDVDTGRQRLHKRQRTTEIEESIGTAELVEVKAPGMTIVLPVARPASTGLLHDLSTA